MPALSQTLSKPHETIHDTQIVFPRHILGTKVYINSTVLCVAIFNFAPSRFVFRAFDSEFAHPFLNSSRPCCQPEFHPFFSPLSLKKEPAEVGYADRFR